MKKGFTLIELLAVIIVIALISAIVVPFVTDIINNAKNKIYKNDIKSYGEAIKKAALAYELEHKKLPESIDDLKDDLKYDGSEITCDIISIVSRDNVYMKGCSVNGNKLNDFIYGEPLICTLVEGKEKEIGSKYQCKVKDDMEEEFKDGYYFYILSIEKDGTYNLIMDRNMCDDGTPATEDNTCLVAWYADDMYNSYGPVTAMKYLYNATKTWINVPPLNYEYKDKEWQESVGVTFAEESGYESFISVNGEGKINGTKFIETEPLRARIPIYAYNDDTEYGEVADYNGANGYLYENLSSEYWDFEEGQPTNNIENIYGYWTLSSHAGHSYDARDVYCGGGVVGDYVDSEDVSGVRPVINLKL